MSLADSSVLNCSGNPPGSTRAAVRSGSESVNGSNSTFTLLFVPSPASSLTLFRNGLLMRQGADYSISINTITFFVASRPQAGDLITANYRY